MLVGFHRADIDPFAVTIGARREVLWVYAHFLDKVPILGAMLRRYGFIAAAYREITGVRNIREMVAVLKEDHALGIFPEGATPLLYPGEDRKFHFSPSFARLATMTGSPVVPVRVRPRWTRIVRYPIPVSLRRRMRLPESVASITRRQRYHKIEVRFAAPIYPVPGERYHHLAGRVEAALWAMEEEE